MVSITTSVLGVAVYKSGERGRNVSGLTWAKNESDDRSLSMKELTETFLKIKTEHQVRYGCPLKVVKLSRLTLMSLPLLHTQEPSAIATFYGVPIEIDDSLGLWEFKEIYA